MKNIIFLFLVLFSLSAVAQNCNIGNQSSTGYTNPGDPIFQDYLVGIKFTLADTATLRSLNLIGRNTKASVKMALYKDKEGIPDALIDSTSTGTVTNGVISFAVTPTVLDTGSYWIMAIYNTNGGHTFSKIIPSGSSDSIVYYKPQSFGSAIPTNASDFIKYKNNTRFTYFLGLDCGITTGITPEKISSIRNLYPNPATDQVSLHVLPNIVGKTYRITNLSGTQVSEGKLTDEITVVDIHALQAGIYFMIIGDREMVKIIKQ